MKPTNEELRHRHQHLPVRESQTVEALRRVREIVAAAAVELNDLLFEGRELERVHEKLDEVRLLALSCVARGPLAVVSGKLSEAVELVARIAAMPDVRAKLGIGDGSIADAVTALVGELDSMKSEVEQMRTQVATLQQELQDERAHGG